MDHITYYYSAHSAYAYLGAARLKQICASSGVGLLHKPIDLSPVVTAVGGRPFRERTQAHVDYFFGREIERWAEWRGVPVIRYRPTHHDNPLDLPNGLLIAAQEQNLDVDALSFAILRAHWRDDADIAHVNTLKAILAELDMPETLLSDALSQETQELHAANTAEAIEQSVFGSPTYLLGEEMFYGQDRLEMLERALSASFAETRWRNPPVS